jgi:hypothetical protein
MAKNIYYLWLEIMRFFPNNKKRENREEVAVDSKCWFLNTLLIHFVW